MVNAGKIVPAPGITVHTDKQGVVREYREVKRKANVGELVKTDRACGEFYASGSVGRVTSQGFGVGVEVDFNGFGNEVKPDGEWYVGSDIGYVVLEPTDIVHHDGKRWREVKRDAQVGDVIRIEDTSEGVHRYHAQYDVTEVKHRDRYVYTAGGACVNDSQYTVLESITAGQPSATVAERIDALEKRVAALEQHVEVLSDKQWLREVERAYSESDSPQQYTREQVIELAKKDVEELRHNGSREYFLTKHRVYCVTDWKINRKKRSIVVLMRGACSGDVYTRGIAKSAPDDCFNVHIGKAIALRRALGLDVPDYYTNAPKPTEAKVGDIVNYGASSNYVVTRSWDGDSIGLKSLALGCIYERWHGKPHGIKDDSHDFGGDSTTGGETS